MLNLAKQIQAARKEGEKLGLTADELAFYDPLTKSQAIKDFYENEELISISMGHIRHWYSGTEYYIDELCVQTDKQGSGIGTYFLNKIEKAIKEIGMANIFLQTENNVPAYGFYQKNGFYELKRHVSFAKKL